MRNSEYGSEKEEKYRPADPLISPRFSGIKTFMRLPHIKTVKGIDFAIVGVPSDAGASFRTGQREGAAAIRKVSALLRHHNPVLGVSPFDYVKGIDYGDLPVVPGYIEDTYKKNRRKSLPHNGRRRDPNFIRGRSCNNLARITRSSLQTWAHCFTSF